MSRLISYPVAGGIRQELSRGRIAEAALARIDRDGIDGLSMRKLGADLGVEAMSLYHYVENKDDLLDAVMALLYDEIKIPEVVDPSDWRSVVRDAMRSFYQVLRSHPSSFALFATRPANCPEAFTTLHAGYGLLRAAGLNATDAYGGLNFAVSYIMGHASEAFRGSEQRVFDVGPPELLNDPSLQDFVGVGRGYTVDQLFEVGLELVISALGSKYDLD